MTNMSNDSLRRYPHYGDRRNEGTNIEDGANFEPVQDYADNIPLEVDMRIDLSQHMNCLHIREYSIEDLTGTTRRPIDHGLGHSREEFEQFQDDGLVSRIDDPGDLESDMPGFNPCQARTMVQLGIASSTGIDAAVNATQAAALGNMGLTNSPPGNIHSDNDGGNFIMVRPGMGGVAGVANDGLGSFGLLAGQLRRWRGTSGLIPAKNLIQLMLTGSVNVSSYEIADVVSLAFTDGGTDCREPFAAQSPADGSTPAGARANLNYIAQNMVYSLFADFMVDWIDAIENFCLNLRYFNNEFVGFFERGFKSHLW
jgi:hypothetical protein